MCADDESGEKAVSVLLSGEESELIFIDHGYTEMTVSTNQLPYRKGGAEVAIMPYHFKKTLKSSIDTFIVLIYFEKKISELLI